MNAEQRKIVSSFYIPAIFVALLWIIKLAEVGFQENFAKFGIFPREISSLKGLITMPFIHSDFKHLFSNSIPLLVLGPSLIYFYRQPALKVFLLIYILHGIWLWLGGRPAYHIGASGLVYGLASFLFFSGVFRRYIRLMAISLLVVFLYGGLIWGLFPLYIGMSWEAHLAGAAAGLICAWYYRKEGPQRPVYDWESEEEDDGSEDESLPGNENGEEENKITVNYHFKPQPDKPQEEGNAKN